MTTASPAPADEIGTHLISRQHLSATQAELITTLFHTMPDMLLVLNEQSRIIAVNDRLLTTFGTVNRSALMELRPGEAIRCIHGTEKADGCGTAETCSSCGVALAARKSRESGGQSRMEYQIMTLHDGGVPLDLEVTATPLKMAETSMLLVALRDISPDKQRLVLERTFFHDILNTVGGIRGIAELLTAPTVAPEIEVQYKTLIVELADNLEEEIEQQRRLLSAERGEYVVDMQDTDLREDLKEICTLYANHDRIPDRTVILEQAPACRLAIDRPMLRRVVGNMVRNALEASPAGAAVRVSLGVGRKNIVITVANPGEMPKEVQMCVFKRSFSTKGVAGRGIGTYSMKLFGERYLGGAVGFRCRDGETVFFIKLPRNAS